MNRNFLNSAYPVRQGFTLLELVLAASLALLVMSGMAGVVLMIYQVQTTNSDHVTTVEIGRNLLKQFEWDLHAIPGVLPEDDSSGSSSSNRSATLQSVEESLSSSASLEFDASTESEMSESDFLLRGDSSTITFYAEPIRRTGRQGQLSTPANQDQEDLFQARRRFIRWGVIEPSDLGGIPQGMSPESLTRFQQVVQPETNGEITLHNDSELFVPEKLAMQFSYFDGSTWVDSWDSGEQQALPKAIEVVLTLQVGKTEQNNPFVSSNAPVKEWTAKRVFLVPTQRFSATSSTSSSSSAL